MYSREPEEEVRAQRILSQAARDAMEAKRIKEDKRRRKRRERSKSGEDKKPDLTEALTSISSVLAAHDDYSDDDDRASDTIPCVRIVVLSTEDPDVVIGSLFLVTCKGIDQSKLFHS